jgi:glutamate synthase (NADPH/NADH) large chain
MTGGRVVVLGGTGRNFGAGMSGGIAYVLDRDGTFPSRVNPEMVDLEALADDDAEWLRDRVERHCLETASTVAEQVLADWDSLRDSFVKVMPKDYKRVLVAEQQARDEGRDPVEAVMAAARA